MIRHSLRAVLFRSPIRPRLSYESVGSDDSEEQINTPKSLSAHSLRKRSSVRIWIVCGLLLVGFILAITLGWRAIFRGEQRESFVPAMKIRGVMFEPNGLFASRPSKESNAAWDNLIPDGHGYVLVPDAAEKYGLEPGIATDEGPDRYSVALYHQIHCLGMIRILFYRLASQGDESTASQHRRSQIDRTHRDNNSHSHLTHASEGPHGYHLDPNSDHVEHCFDYLRQALMCAGDMTIEHAREPPLGEKRETTDGWGVEHQCKDWNEMLHWTLDHKANHTLAGILA